MPLLYNHYCCLPLNVFTEYIFIYLLCFFNKYVGRGEFKLDKNGTILLLIVILHCSSGVYSMCVPVLVVCMFVPSVFHFFLLYLTILLVLRRCVPASPHWWVWDKHLY